MSDNIVLEVLQKFIHENVASQSKLQKPTDKDMTKYELVNPSVHIGWVPPKLSENMSPDTQVPDYPCIIIGVDEGDDDGQDAGVNIRMSFALYNLGLYGEDGKITPDYKGYKDLLNLKDATKRELARAAVIGGVTTIQGPFKWGMYQDQPYPYWFGWLSFRALCSSDSFVPDIEEQYK